jgi:hypothetical protein
MIIVQLKAVVKAYRLKIYYYTTSEIIRQLWRCREVLPGWPGSKKDAAQRGGVLNLILLATTPGREMPKKLGHTSKKPVWRGLKKPLGLWYNGAAIPNQIYQLTKGALSCKTNIPQARQSVKVLMSLTSGAA